MSNIPQDLIDALKTAGLGGFFSGCTNAHQNEYLKWINEAKRPETRRTRIARAVQMISHKCTEEKAHKKTGKGNEKDRHA